MGDKGKKGVDLKFTKVSNKKNSKTISKLKFIKNKP